MKHTYTAKEAQRAKFKMKSDTRNDILFYKTTL
jgi:hypothetical protein